MAVGEFGEHWAVHRQLIEPQRASHLGERALSLVPRLVDEGLLSHVKAEHGAWTEWELNVAGAKAPEFLAAELPPRFMGLAELCADIERVFEQRVTDFFFNTYPPYGGTKLHQDKIGEATIAIGLLGQGRAHILEPATDEVHTLLLQPGDALHFVNTAGEEDRPKHMVRNVLAEPRVSFVAQLVSRRE